MLVNVKDQEMIEFNKFVEEKAFAEAEALIRKKEFPKTILNFNLGYLEYEKGNLVNAKKYLESAKFSGMFSDEVDSALELINSELDIIYTEQEISDFDNFIFNSASLPPEFFPTISVLMFLLSGILLLKKIRIMGVSFLVGGIAFLSLFCFIKDLSIKYNLEEGIVYRGPSRIFEEKQAVPAGIKLIFSKEVKDWKYIKYPSIYEGWVYENKAI